MLKKSLLLFYKAFAYNSANIIKPGLRNKYFMLSRCRHYSSQKDLSDGKLVHIDPFLQIANKNRETFLEMLEIYKTREKHRRGLVEFINSALKYMKEFHVDRDLEVYKALIDLFPKGKLVPRNMFQAEFMHYPKHQQCAIDLLEQMEESGVIPDWSMQDQLVSVFGETGYPVRRYWRMMYWLPKFKNASPWPLPNPVPSDSFQLSEMAIKRICCVDVSSDITVFKTSELKDSLDDTWIVSGQSEEQRHLISIIPERTPVYVEGGFRIWLRNKPVTYFILRADSFRKYPEEIDTDDVSDLKIPMFSKLTEASPGKPSVHEQSDGVILGVCVTGTSSRDSLLSWVRLLERGNPHLASLVVLFSQGSPVGETSPVTEDRDKGTITDGLSPRS